VSDSWRAQVLFSRRDGKDELTEVIRRLGLELEGSGYSRLGLKLNGQHVVIESEFHEPRRDLDDLVTVYDKTLEAVHLVVKFEGVERSQLETGAGAPSIELRRETVKDRRDKTTGLVKELQTGFAGFDKAVFIDNDSTEADARRVLAKEATRQAVLRLLEYDVGGVFISTTSVSVRLLARGKVHVEELLHALEDLLIVARAGGPKSKRPGRRGEHLAELMVAASVLSAGYALVPWYLNDGSVLPLFVGVVIGGIAGFFTRPFFESRVAGDSGSGARAWKLTAAAMVTAGGLCAGLLQTLNTALDSGEGEVHHGVITGVIAKSTSKNFPDVRAIDVRFRDGEERRVRWTFDATVGWHYRETRHKGGLGFEWVTDRTVVR
jgi:hypothetical protein